MVVARVSWRAGVDGVRLVGRAAQIIFMPVEPEAEEIAEAAVPAGLVAVTDCRNAAGSDPLGLSMQEKPDLCRSKPSNIFTAKV